MTGEPAFHDEPAFAPRGAAPDGPRVSVVMPVFNAEGTLATQLEALARQEFDEPWELIVVDNGSTDGSVEVARGFTGRLPMRIIDAPTVQGAGHARNVGAREARAPKLLFVDADDEVAAGWMRAIASALDRHDAVASRFDKSHLNTPEVQRARGPKQTEGLSPHNYATFLPHASASGLAVRRAVHEAIGGFDESLLRLEDTDYSWRLQLAGHEIHFEPDAVVHYRYREGGASSIRQAYAYGRYNGRLYNRYRARGMAHAPLRQDLKYIAKQLARLPATARGADREKRLRSLANRAGILLGRLESSWGRR